MQILHNPTLPVSRTLARAGTPPGSNAHHHSPQTHFRCKENPTLSGLRGRLPLVYDCWNLLELPDGNS
ncbi:hypothetical protein [Synechococcus sp. CBW1006]|uniref:hypothetical protein n=1 Tax=Synechococcus sp. CBW1006 TaxID=1353138 RepID=UPI0018CFE53D|nr:hypothetical protein [Synechococcus sp. CBW1006]QPN68773.1 hypothetical protein H8F26_04920 [Synechococcus sp. CBW1006]